MQEQPTDAPGVTPPHVWVQLAAGGREVYLNPDAQGVYPASWRSRATLVKVSASPLRYERRLPDGMVEVYTQADGAPAGPHERFGASQPGFVPSWPASWLRGRPSWLPSRSREHRPASTPARL